MIGPRPCCSRPSSGRRRSPELLRLLGGVRFARTGPGRRGGAQEGRSARSPRRAHPVHPGHVVRGDGPSGLGATRASYPCGGRSPKRALRLLDRPPRLRRRPVRGRGGRPQARRSRSIPAFMKAHDNLGLSYEALGRSDEAIASYETALRLNRASTAPSPWPALNLGLLLRSARVASTRPRRSFASRCAPIPRSPRATTSSGSLSKRGADATRPSRSWRTRRGATPPIPSPNTPWPALYRRGGDAAQADRALDLFQRLKKEKSQAGSEPRQSPPGLDRRTNARPRTRSAPPPERPAGRSPLLSTRRSSGWPGRCRTGGRRRWR